MATSHSSVQLYKRVDRSLTLWMARNGIRILRVSLGIVFLWFGILKFFPGMSPAEKLAADTIRMLTFGLVPRDLSLVLLAGWECLIGAGLLFGVYLRVTLLLLFVQMLGAATPLLLMPGDAFTHVPWAPTLEGQYIIKNLVILSAGLVIGATVRGGRFFADRTE